jgi:hypothetical protein
MMSKEMDSGDGPVTELSVPRLYNLLIDPKEEHPAMPSTPENFWIRIPVGTMLGSDIHVMLILRRSPRQVVVTNK